MNTSSLDILVIGNETAGLWFLRRYWEVTRLVPESSSKVAAWIELSDCPSSTFLPATVATSFGIDCQLENSHEIEMITPKRVFRWNQPFLLKYGLDPATTPLSPSNREWKQIAGHLHRFPELLGFASGIWKWIGLTQTTSAERIFWASLLCHRYRNLEAHSLVPDGVMTQRLSLPDRCTRLEWQKNQKWLLEFSNGQTLETSEILFNCSMTELAKRFPEEALKTYLPNPNLQPSPQESGLVALQWTLPKSDVPTFLQPLSLLFETEEIPDPATEIWPVTAEILNDKALVSVWCESQDQCFDAEQKMLALMPSLQKAESKQAVPTSKQHRRTSVILSHTTRHPRLHYFGPELCAQYPFPLGPLQKAQDCVRHVLGRKILRLAQQVLDKRA